MAITQVTQYNSTPTVVGDYAAQNGHIQAFINQTNNHSFILTDPTATTIPAIALGTYISSGGTLFLVDTANYTILGSVASGNNYIKMSVSGTTLTATWIQDISVYAYNPIYGYLASGTDMILPYLVVYDGTSVYNKYRNDIISNVNFSTVNTGQGANEVYRTSREIIDFGTATVAETKTISDMISGEIRFVSIIGTISASIAVKVLLPSGGYYDVVDAVSGSDIISNRGLLAGGTLIFTYQWSSDKTANFSFVIRMV